MASNVSDIAATKDLERENSVSDKSIGAVRVDDAGDEVESAAPRRQLDQPEADLAVTEKACCGCTVS